MKNIRKLFDYQRFEENERLSSMIRRTESKYLGSSRQELDEEAYVVATGGMALMIAEESKVIDKLDGLLTLKGLRLIYERNRA